MKNTIKHKTRMKSRAQAGNPVASRLQDAVVKWVEAKGGKLIIVGEIEIQEWPNDQPHCFRVAIRCMGRKPDYATK